jgi:RNA polymerase sigma factor (sigma-70 family)
MDETPPPGSFFEKVLLCEAAIARIREAQRQGNTDTEQVEQDWNLIRASVQPRFAYWAQRVASFAPEAAQEAMEMMNDQLQEDIAKSTFPSLETKFGAYLTTMPKRVLFVIGQKYLSDGVSLRLERLDERAEDGTSLQDSVSDPGADADFENADVRMMLDDALTVLTPIERFVWTRRWQGMRNNEVAERLGVSEMKASIIYKRACRKLKARLQEPGEEADG